jgi:hypothetical protein
MPGALYRSRNPRAALLNWRAAGLGVNELNGSVTALFSGLERVKPENGGVR